MYSAQHVSLYALVTKSKELGDISSHCYSFLSGPLFPKESLKMVHKIQEYEVIEIPARQTSGGLLCLTIWPN